MVYLLTNAWQLIPQLPLKSNDLPPETRVEAAEKPTPATGPCVDSASHDTEQDTENDTTKHLPAPLTRNNLTLFNKMGRERRRTNATLSTSPESVADSTTTKATRTTAPQPRNLAFQNGILLSGESKAPTNLNDIRIRHARRRESINASESRFNAYARKVGHAPNEMTVGRLVDTHLLKDYNDDDNDGQRYDLVVNQQLKSLPRNSGLNNNLPAPQPTILQGLIETEFAPFPIHEYVPGAVYDPSNCRSVTLPHFSGDLKRQGGDVTKLAAQQSAYNGATHVLARNRALSYLGRPDPAGHAEVTTFTADGTVMNFFAHYAAPSGLDGSTQYHQFKYASVDLTISHSTYSDGRRGLRNAQDRAKESSTALKDGLIEKYQQQKEEEEEQRCEQRRKEDNSATGTGSSA